LGRFVFKQYIKSKRDRLKKFKLRISSCCTIAIKVYAGKEDSIINSFETNVVMDLSEPYLDYGRMLYIDN